MMSRSDSKDELVVIQEQIVDPTLDSETENESKDSETENESKDKFNDGMPKSGDELVVIQEQIVDPSLDLETENESKDSETENESKDKFDDGMPKSGDKCKGEKCERFYDIYNRGMWSFKKIESPALVAKSAMKSPVAGSKDPFNKCELCGKGQGFEDSPQDGWEVDKLSEKQSCCLRTDHKCWKWAKKCRTPAIDYFWPGVMKYNPIWTGDDNNQIGIFIRNLTVLGISEKMKTISLQFYLNVVWLDKGFCQWTIERNKGIHKALKDEWYIQLRTEDYEKRYEEYLKSKMDKVEKSDWQEALKGSMQREPEKQYNTLPSIVIWNLTDDGYKEIENLVSLNKKHIGKNTIYWRRLIRATLHVNFYSLSFPFGYESFKLRLRLLSWTEQHFVLLRTKLWHEMHLNVLNGSTECEKKKGNINENEYKQQLARNELLADHTFSYIHPDNSRIPDWKVCSVHGKHDQWISCFDHNEIEFRLPVCVSRGLDTQSSFEAMIVLKHVPHFVLWNSWFWFSLSTILALLTYQLNPDEWEGRLGIAVAVIFVQMNLRNHSNQNYPRVGKMTALDVHISACVFCVLLQAFVQCLIIVINDPETNSENLDQIDWVVGWVNLTLVLLINVATYRLAKWRQKLERLNVESMIRWYTGFNREPLGEHEPGAIEETVELKGMDCGVRMQVYDKVLDKIMLGRGRTVSSIHNTNNRTFTSRLITRFR